MTKAIFHFYEGEIFQRNISKKYLTLHSFRKMNFKILLNIFGKIAAMRDYKCF